MMTKTFSNQSKLMTLNHHSSRHSATAAATTSLFFSLLKFAVYKRDLRMI